MTIAPLLDAAVQGKLMPGAAVEKKSSDKGDFMQAFSNAKDSMMPVGQPVKTEGTGAKGKDSDNNAAMDAADRNRSVNENRARSVRDNNKSSAADKAAGEDEGDIREKAASGMQQLLADIMELLGGITPQELEDALSQLGLNAEDLLNAGSGNMLVAQLFGEGDLASLLADSDLSDMASKLSGLIADAIEDMKGLMPGENAERLMGPALNDALKDMNAAAQSVEDLLSDAVLPIAAVDDPDPMGQEIGNGQNSAEGEDDGKAGRSEKREHAEFNELREDQPVFTADAQQNVQTDADALREVSEQIRYTTDPQDILDQVADRIKTHVKEDMSTLEMVLHPASLGNVALNLTSKDGSVSAQFTAQSEAVKAALESQLQVLKENLEQAGVKVTSVEVTVGSHAFEQNLEQGNDGQSEAEAREQERLRRATRRIDLGLDAEGGIEDIDDADAVTVDMMRADGNRMDHRI